MRKILATLLVVAGAFTSLIVSGSVAAADVQPQSCVTNTITTGPFEGVGTTATKSSSSTCHDLNLTFAHDNQGFGGDSYAARLFKSSTGKWFTAARGYVGVADGSYAVDKVVLATDVLGGTKFTVASEFDAGDTVKITH
jgi:hypothetical protein